jgi:hypothetical protein
MHGYAVSCGCLSESAGCFRTRTTIEKLLEGTDIRVTKEKTFDDLINPATGKHLYFDLVLKRKNQFLALIEYDGEQHFKEVSHFTGTLEEQKNRDTLKDEYAKSHNIPFLRITFRDYIDNTADEKIQQFLQNISGNSRTPKTPLIAGNPLEL